jgi:hypothetical protein
MLDWFQFKIFIKIYIFLNVGCNIVIHHFTPEIWFSVCTRRVSDTNTIGKPNDLKVKQWSENAYDNLYALEFDLSFKRKL